MLLNICAVTFEDFSTVGIYCLSGIFRKGTFAWFLSPFSKIDKKMLAEKIDKLLFKIYIKRPTFRSSVDSFVYRHD